MRRREHSRCCIVRGCGARIAGWKWLCDRHFRALPFDRRRQIAEAGQARAPHVVSRLAMEGAAWLAEHSPAAEAARRIGERE
ncbi:MAG: hypothetical protein AB7O91_03995 [Sphingomonas sp.]